MDNTNYKLNFDLVEKESFTTARRSILNPCIDQNLVDNWNCPLYFNN